MKRIWLTTVLALAIAGCGTAGPTVRPLTTGAMSAQNTTDTWPATFNAADTNHDGALSAAELGLNASQFAVLDRNGDGKVTLDEWQAQVPTAAIDKAMPKFEPLVQALFQKLDTNHDQAVTMDELDDAMPPASLLPAESNQIGAAFREADQDGRHALSLAEFHTFYRSVDGAPTQGFFGDLARGVLGGYLAVMSRVAEHFAMHSARHPATQTPAIWKIPFQNVTLKSQDGLTLHGWYIPASVKTDKAVLMLHGHGDSRGMFVREQQILWCHPQYNILAIDLRNHGDSGGNVTTYGYGEGLDALAGVNYLKAQGNARIAAYGISLGGAAAIRAAALTPDINVVVDDCAYATVLSAFTGFISHDLVPGAGLVAAATLARGNRDLGYDMAAFEPLTQDAKLAPRPFFVIQGGADQYITPQNGQNNYAAAGNCPKEYWVAPNAKHAMSAVADAADYKSRLLAFLGQYL
ncbi:MAG TPA: alpha/beta fold hydrolase [Oscillatoriaceae cyanobacterium]